MSDLNLGKMRAATNGSQDSTLRSVKKVLSESPKFKGKISDTAINMILDAVSQINSNIQEYNLNLTSADNDTLVEKIKFIINSLYNGILSISEHIFNVQELNNIILSILQDQYKPSLNQIEDQNNNIIKYILNSLSSKSADNSIPNVTPNTDNNTAVTDKINEIKDTLDEFANSDQNKDKKNGKYTNFSIADNFTELHAYIKDQFIELNKNLNNSFSFSHKLLSIHIPFKGFFTKAFSGITGKFKALGAGIKSLGKNILGKITSPFKALGAGIKSLGKNILGKITSPFKALGAGIKSLGSKLKFPKLKFPKLKIPFFKKSNKEKKAEKKQNSIFNSLEKLVKRLKKFANSTKTMVLDFLKSIIVPAAKIIASAIDIILKPIINGLILAMWGSGIAIYLILIAFGILALSLAFKKFTDWFVDDIGPIVEDMLRKVSPETINRMANAVAGFVEVMTEMMKPIGKALDLIVERIVEPVSEFIKIVLESLIKNIAPHIDTIVGIIVNVVVKILKVIEPIILKIIDIVGGFIMACLKGLEPIIKAMEPLIILIGEIVGGVIKGCVLVIEGIVTGVKLAIQYIRDHWDEFVAFVKNLPSKIINFIKTLPSLILNGVKKLVQFGKVLQNWYYKKVKIPIMKKLIPVEFSIFGKKFRPFAFLNNELVKTEEKVQAFEKEQAEMEAQKDMDALKEKVQQEQEELAGLSDEELKKRAEEEKKNKEEAEAKKKAEEMFRTYVLSRLSKISEILKDEFSSINKKLDEPNVMPLPIVNGTSNQANMSQNW